MALCENLIEEIAQRLLGEKREEQIFINIYDAYNVLVSLCGLFFGDAQ